jgi:hypothetical protein
MRINPEEIKAIRFKKDSMKFVAVIGDQVWEGIYILDRKTLKPIIDALYTDKLLYQGKGALVWFENRGEAILDFV